MKIEQYHAGLDAPRPGREALTRAAEVNNVRRLEGYLGQRVDLPRKQWGELVGRLDTFTARDWARVRAEGLEAIPEAVKRRSKARSSKAQE